MSVEPVRHVASMWVGSNLGPWESICLASFVRAGMEVDLYTYAEVAGVPKGVSVREAARLLPYELAEESHAATGNHARFSDLFRYTLLHETPVTWVDADVICLGRLGSTNGYLLGFEGFGRVNNAVLGFPPHSEFSAYLVTEANKIFLSGNEWGMLGPSLITRAIAEFKLWSLVQSEEKFYPYPWRQAWRLFDPTETAAMQRLVSNADVIHLWNEALKANPHRLKQSSPHPQSLGQQIARNYSPDWKFESSEFDFESREWRDWTRGLDPANQGRTLAFVIRKILRRLPQPLLGIVNRWAFAFRQLIIEGSK